MKTRDALLAVAVMVIVYSVPALAQDDLRTISHHSSSGTGHVSEATEVGIDKPKRVLLKIRVKPNVLVEGKYIQSCRGGEGERKGKTKEFKTRSTLLEVPTFFDKAKSCLFYAEVERANDESRLPVKLSIRVLAAQRPGAAYRVRE